MKCSIAALALLVFSTAAHADTTTDWTFTFTGQGVSGSGEFTTDSSQCGSFGCVVSGLEGEVNGTALAPESSILQSAGPNDPFADSSVFQFALDGTTTWIEWGQEAPLAGSIWFFGNGWDGIGDVPIDLTVVDPVNTPEPGTLLLFAIGLAAVCALSLKRW